MKSYSHRAVRYIPTAYFSYNWKSYPLIPFTHFCQPLYFYTFLAVILMDLTRYLSLKQKEEPKILSFLSSLPIFLIILGWSFSSIF